MVVPRRNLHARYGGGWALVTGASDGLGEQYAHQLARSGFNIILMARNEAKLSEKAKEIRAAYNVETQVVVFDFAKLATPESVAELQGLLSTLKQDISILVNNVGTAEVGFLHNNSVQTVMTMINVNVNAQVYMTQAMLPVLLKREGRSAIVDLSSRCA